MKKLKGLWLASLTAVVAGAMFFPNLGAHSLWDVDESRNAECAREMLESDNWRVPTFNYQLRPDKPVLLYWLMIAAYQWLGVNEFAARCWSALAGVGTCVVTTLLGAGMFGIRAGLLAGIVLATSVLFSVSSHAATPDAVLVFFVTLTMAIYWWLSSRQTGAWIFLTSATCGLAVLTKGPVGVVLPGAIVMIHLLWSRQVRQVSLGRLALGLLIFCVVALPWYVFVAAETKKEFVKEFILRHNISRFLAPMERHSGPWFYHLVTVFIGFAPWSGFLPLALWYLLPNRRMRDEEWTCANSPPPTDTLDSDISHTCQAPCADLSRSAIGLLSIWIVVWFAFFSVAQTKLPNYVLPAYPALALLVGRFLDRWCAGMLIPWRTWTALASIGFVATGAGFALGVLVLDGIIDIDALAKHRVPGVAPWAFLALVPIVGGCVAAGSLCRSMPSRQNPKVAVWALSLSAIVFAGLAGAFGPPALEEARSAKSLSESLNAARHEEDIDVAVYGFNQPGLVFYMQQHIRQLHTWEDVVDWLRRPRESYVVTRAEHWHALQAACQVPVFVVSQKRDFTTGKEAVLLSNRPPRWQRQEMSD